MPRPDFKKIYFYGALLYAFLIPFHQQAATMAIILWALLSIVTFKKKATYENPYLLVLPILYLSYCSGIFTSEGSSLHFLEHKLSFLVFPLVFFLHAYSEYERKKILSFFIWGLTVSALVCLGVALYRSIGFESETVYFRPNVLEGKAFMESILYGGNYFFGRYFSLFHQTVYFAFYFCTGIAILLFHSQLLKSKVRFTLLAFFLVLIFLISNKASFIAVGMVFAIRLMTKDFDLKKKLIGLSSVLLVLALIVAINPRTKESIRKVVNGELVLNKKARYGFSTRLLSWDAALTLISANPVWGYGAGDTQAKLNEEYAGKEYIFPLRESYNAHNQWLQIWLENGLIGLIILTFIFALLFRSALRSKENAGFILAITAILITNSMFESIFNRFSGVSIFAFLVCFIFSGSTMEKTKK